MARKVGVSIGTICLLAIGYLSGRGKSPQEQLIGSWQSPRHGIMFFSSVSFDADGTFSGSVPMGDATNTDSKLAQEIVVVTGRWKIEDGYLVIVFAESKFAEGLGGIVQKERITSSSGDSITTVLGDGSSVTYTRKY